ncbi:hypothetical protein CR513_62937, partial [Mucuna pruriens]
MSDPPIVKELEGLLRNVEAERKVLKRKLSNAISLQVETQEEVLKERRLHMQAIQEAHRERELRVKIGECLKATDCEMCLKREEKDQATNEKESLKEILKNAKRKEVELKGQLYGLRERLDLQHEELLRERPHREVAEARENLALCELVEERQAVEGKEQKTRATRVELREEVTAWKSQFQELSIQIEMKIRSIEEETDYWKDKYNKTVWLANQALEALLRGLRAVEAMINPLTTPPKISEFVNQCRTITKVSHPYGIRAKTRQMENAVEALEKRNEELRSEMEDHLTPKTPRTTHLDIHRLPFGTRKKNDQRRRRTTKTDLNQFQGQDPRGRMGRRRERQQPIIKKRIPKGMRGVVEGIDRYGIDAADLCLVSDVVHPMDFKVPNFDKYRGSSCPRTHLAMYCQKMTTYVQDEKILVHCFQDSLSRAALSWYVNLERGCIKTWKDLVEAFLK